MLAGEEKWDGKDPFENPIKESDCFVQISSFLDILSIKEGLTVSNAYIFWQTTIHTIFNKV